MATYKGIGYEPSSAKYRTGTASDDIEFDSLITATDGVAVTGALTSTTLSVTGDASIGGDLDVAGDIISRGAVNLVVEDNFIDLNFGNTTTTSESGGLTISMNRTTGFTSGTVTTFVAGVAATSNPTFTNTDATGSSLLAAADIVMITGATQQGNNGLYQVLSVSAASFPQVVTITGIGTTGVDGSLPFCQTQFEAESGATAVSSKIDLAVWAVADGTNNFLDASGANYAKGTFVTAYATSAVLSDFDGNGDYTTASSTLQSAYDGGPTIVTSGSTDIALTLASGDLTASGAGAVLLTPTSASSFTSGAALTLTGAAASAWSTSAGNLTIDSSAATLVLDGHTGVDIDATDSGKVSIDGAGGIDIGVAADVAIDIDSSTLDIDASGAITIDGTSTLSLDAADTVNLTMAANVAAAKTLTIQGSNADGTAGSVGNIAILTDGTVQLDSSGGAAGLIAIGSNGVSTDIVIGDDTGTRTIQIGRSAGAGSTVQISSQSGTLLLDATGQTINADGALDQDGTSWNLNATAGSSSVNIAANDASTYTLGIQGANAGDGHVVVDIDSDNAVQINAAAASNFTTSGGGLTLAGAAGVTVTSTGGTLSLNGTGQVVDLNATNLDIDDAGATTIDSVGVSIDSSAASNFTTSAGALTLTSAVAANWSTSAGRLTLEGAGGATVTSTGGELILNGTGQTVTMNSAALDVNATGAITVDGDLTMDLVSAGNATMLSTGGNIEITADDATKNVAVESNFPNIIRRMNADGTGVTVGDCLYAQNSGGNLVVSSTDADAAGTSQFIGVAGNTAAGGASCKVIFAGVVRNVTGDASYVAGTNLGKPVYLSTVVGKVSLTPPSGAGDVIFQVGICVGGAVAAWEVLLQPRFVMEIG